MRSCHLGAFDLKSQGRLSSTAGRGQAKECNGLIGVAIKPLQLEHHRGCMFQPLKSNVPYGLRGSTL